MVDHAIGNASYIGIVVITTYDEGCANIATVTQHLRGSKRSREVMELLFLFTVSPWASHLTCLSHRHLHPFE